MIHYNPLLCLDFYKTAHAEQYPQNLTKMVSYYTPRMTRLDDTDKVALFGLQAFIREYLINAFDENFFDVSWWDVLYEYIWGIFPWRFGPSRRVPAPTSRYRKLRFPTPILTSCGWSTPLKPCCLAPCGTPKCPPRSATVTAKSLMSLLSVHVTMMWFGPGSSAIFLCAGRKVSRAPPRVLRHSASAS